MLYIGESINATIKSVKKAILDQDEAFLIDLARAQVETGSQLLDANAGTGRDQEAEDLVWLVELVQKNVDVPLCLDSSDPKAIEAAMKVHKGIPMVNSISGERQKMDALLPVVADAPCKVIALCIGNNGIPATPEERFEVGRSVVKELEKAGVKKEDIYLDAIVMGVATDCNAGVVTLKTLELIKKELPDVKTVFPVSNVGFGLPGRVWFNSIFTAFAVERGLDALICDTRSRKIMTSVMSSEVLLGRDNYCLSYLKAYKKELLEQQKRRN
jgi:cobalamin-dependent methionine synthase I